MSFRPSSSWSLKGLYVILDPAASPERALVDVLAQAAENGLTLFQYRDKTSAMREVYRQAAKLRRAAADAGALFLVNKQGIE